MTELQRLTEVLSILQVAQKKHQIFCLVAMARVEAAAFGHRCEKCDDFRDTVQKTEAEIAAIPHQVQP